MNKEKIFVFQDDIPQDTELGETIAIDTETTGLIHNRDRLCLIQICGRNNICYLIKINIENGILMSKPRNLERLLKDKKVLKIFHYARFDIAVLNNWIGDLAGPIFCTKIASKLVRTYTNKHGLKDLCKELIGIELSKEMQSSDWAQETLSEQQKIYAAQDVIYLHKLYDKLIFMLEREKRTKIATKCFEALEARVLLDLNGWSNEDIFSH
ncbi:MAG: ribonuclease D [Rhodospirillaceae bacterium]|jgi:Ribonuclease D|nr:ribonuclease D [Rhodospirillaceae bacterium]|tara:strand:+ start:73 stop:705 length:633 start_codon:yes stop_codon:yes gene_type:complete